jgi:ferredoxin
VGAISALLLTKEKWPEFLGKISGKQLFAPKRQGDRVYLAPLKEGELPDFDFQNTLVPPKALVFPQTETLYRYRLGETEMKEPAIEGEAVLLGVRPCDGRAMQLVERLFCWDVDDPYYLKRRALVTVVGLACSEPGLNCFCSSVGGGPASTEGLDLLMTDLGESFLLEPLTDKGRALLAEAGELLAEAPPEAVAQKEQIAAEAAARIKRSVDTAGIPEGLPRLWNDPLWQRHAAACLGCGTCTYLCPTCHCFDIQDEAEGTEARRLRVWDSCMFEEYTRHASGHNPRPTRRERTRNRISHKYGYFVQKFGIIACVGCGRCVNLCPVNIDLIEILRQVKEAL